MMAALTMNFVGLDIETTGSREDESQLIQIGIAMRDKGALVRVAYDVGWAWGEYSLTAEAMKVNGFTTSRIERGLPAHFVDSQLCDWLNRLGAAARSLIPVGWNVGSFDMPYVRRTLPHMTGYLHKYRSADLNAACFLLGGDDWESFKKRAKKYAARELGEEKWHDAGYDAAASLLAWEWLRGTFKLN